MSAEADKMVRSKSEPPSRSPSDVLKIRILSILLVLVLVAFGFYALASEGVFDPPYPSQDTPLTLQPWGVTWSRSFNETLGLVTPIWAYDDMSVALKEYDEGGMAWTSGPFLLGESIEVSAFVPPATVEEAEEMSWLGRLMYSDYGVEVDVFTVYFVSDHTDPDVFNRGDTISFVHLIFRDGSLSSVGFEEGIIYEIVLMCETNGLTSREGYGLAIEDGKLYSWMDRGPVDDPLS